MLGWTRKQCVGRSPAEFLVAVADRDHFSRSMESALSNSGGTKASVPQTIELIRSPGDTVLAQLRFNRLQIGSERYAIVFIRAASGSPTSQVPPQAPAQTEMAGDNDPVTVGSTSGSGVVQGDEFLANVTHELRTPMNAIIGMTDLALEEGVSDVVREYLLTARDSADAMLTLINDILDYSRLNTGPGDLEKISFDVRRLLEETMRGLSLRANERGLELAAAVHPDVPFRIYGDPPRLRQLLSNLIGNAIKFTERGEVVVEIGLDETAVDPNDKEGWKVGDTVRLHFSVRDTGIGIAAANQGYIFAPFVQLDSSRTRSYSGTGLGLSICAQLARLMGGTIHVESAPERGSTFHFTASFGVAPALNELPTTVPGVPEQLAGIRVLIVDDNESIRRILQEMVASWGMLATTADGVESAIQLIQAASSGGNEFQLVIVDAIMPKRDGIEFLRALDDTDDRPGVSILMMSPADQRLYRKRIDGLHVNAFLEKPVSQLRLLNSITDAFGGIATDLQRDAAIETTSHSLNVLAAEDIPANQKVVTAILSRRGHRPTIANNGREAIDLFERQDFDVILMDVQMPILDGIQATRAIREIERGSGRRIPIVAMTAHAMPGDREACKAAGMDGYMSKPLDARLLLKTIEQLQQPRVPSRELLNSFVTKSGFWRMKQEQSGSKPLAVKGKTLVSAPANPVELWKPEVALRRMGGDIELLSSMVDYFLTDSPKLLADLQRMIKIGDAAEAARAAHSLKGLCSNFEAAEATQVALETEMACLSGKLTESELPLAHLTEKIASLSQELIQWKNQQARTE